MSDLAIRVEHLSKAYWIGLREQPQETMLGALTAWLKAPLTNFRAVRNLSAFGPSRDRIPGELASENFGTVASQGSCPQIFWALKDICFAVKPGGALGIIGRNGAGKSTLLKVLSRITAPTSGRALIYGRVASLLEVGTGFHPDLTGRENIYLNGSILGMKKREINARFDAIVDFSGIGKFIDTPTKRYSSGMRVRLAFSVAAHLEPEILIVDEVLAVGDTEFQKKCLGKMQHVAGQGRTVLFVSHNLAAIQNLCDAVMVLEAGETRFMGNTASGIAFYLNQCALSRDTSSPHDLPGTRPPWAIACIHSARTLNAQGLPVHVIPLGGEVVIEMRIRCPEGTRLDKPVMGVVLNHALFGAVGGINMRMTGHDLSTTVSSQFVMRCRLRELPFLPGSYSVDLWLGDGGRDIDAVTGCLTLQIEGTDIYGTGKLPFANLGVAFLKADWEVADDSATPSNPGAMGGRVVKGALEARVGFQDTPLGAVAMESLDGPQPRIGTMNQAMGVPGTAPASGQTVASTSRVGDRRSGSWRAPTSKTGCTLGP
jgi:lipopolysaccharide transport system ATP-binding protein